jgi:uncharacterized phage-associated protein
MRIQFNEAKAAQTAARLLSLRGGPMSYLKLIKLLYFVDRQALLRWGRPVTTDQYVSMDRGPVVSRIYDLITEEPGPDSPTVWYSLISPPEHFEVSLRQDPPPSDELSIAEEQLIGEVFAKFGKMSRWELVQLSHKLPEWKNPEGSAIPLDYVDILRAENKPQDEINEIVEELEHLGEVQALIPRRS